MAEIASGSIDLKSLKIAGEGASKYITEISGDGIKIHDGISANPNYVSITSAGMEVYQKTNSTTVNKVAEFKSYINIGSGNNNNNNAGSALIGTGLIAENERQVVLGAYNRSPNGGTFVIGGGQNSSNRANLLSVHNISGQTVTDTFIASTTSSGQSFTVTNIITSIIQINVDDTTLSSSNYTYTGQDVTINTSIAEGSKVEIAYVTSSQKGYMVLGQAQAVFGAFSITMADSAAYGYGSIAGGDSSDSPGAIKASGIGSVAMGKVSSTGEITASGTGASIHGCAVSNNSTMTALGIGASIHGYAGNNSTITASSTGTSIHGYAYDGTIIASNTCATVHGYASHSTIKASGHGASIYGYVANSSTMTAYTGASINGYADNSSTMTAGTGASIHGYANNSSTMIARGVGSIALNESTHALHRAQLAIGTYNADDSAATATHPSGTITYGTYALIIGNGTAEDARSNAFMVDWSGDIYPQATKMTDFIIEQGTSDIWTYRKWNSGISECWGRYTWNITAWSAWGNWYYSNASSAINYPTNLFTVAPSLTTNGRINGLDCALYCRSGSDAATNTATFAFFRPSGGTTGTGQLSLYAIGKWK